MIRPLSRRVRGYGSLRTTPRPYRQAPVARAWSPFRWMRPFRRGRLELRKTRDHGSYRCEPLPLRTVMVVVDVKREAGTMAAGRRPPFGTEIRNGGRKTP